MTNIPLDEGRSPSKLHLNVGPVKSSRSSQHACLPVCLCLPEKSIQEPSGAIFFLHGPPGFCKKEVHQKGGDPADIGKPIWTGEVIVT